MIEIKEEAEEVDTREVRFVGSSDTGSDIQNEIDDVKRTEENEDSLNNNIEKDNLLLKVEKEDSFPYDEEGDDKLDEDQDRHPTLTGMSPVETATLLLLSRIALFNKVRKVPTFQSPKSL